MTASLPGTGLSWAGLLGSEPPPPSKTGSPEPDYHAAMREAFAQAAQKRLVPIAFDEIASETPHTRREIAADAMPIFVRIMKANGVDRDAAKFSVRSLLQIDDEEFDLLIAEITGIAPAPRRPGRYPRASGRLGIANNPRAREFD